MFYELNGNHVLTVEAVLSRPSESVHHLQVWDNGESLAEGTFDENAPHVMWSWQVLNDCLASRGISWALISVIGVVLFGRMREHRRNSVLAMQRRTGWRQHHCHRLLRGRAVTS